MHETNSYKPISCEVHDGYELACMRRAIHELIWLDEEGSHRKKLRFLVLDYSGGQEYLVAEEQSGETLRIRLDRITSTLPY